ncbi:serine hydrolase domain-containing protein [Clostridium oryzae]|uniref:Esterase EstB n=1 Tax=Clostridium oryzae TaxID=1450648 RepID=A0A1V4IE24_9CLOT|nr:serine hydrolase domain-containing protein [Clostridium oryzae]OPJ57905.1 esterase EstB [Clostridium oryzae]
MGSFKSLDELLKSFCEDGPAGASCIVNQDGNTLYEGYFGYADLENRMAIDEDTIFRIFSMTKVITCTAALMLYERGKFLLTDPIEEYLPEFKNPKVYRYSPRGELFVSPASRPLTIKDFFNMTTGLTYEGDIIPTAKDIAKIREEMDAEGKYSIRDFVKRIAEVPLSFDPGTHWQYSLNHDVLGAFIEVLSGKSFGEFLEEEIFKPLGMKNTSFRIPEEKKDRLSVLYGKNEQGKLMPITDMDAFYQEDAILESGGAGLLSTLGDYSKFAQMLAFGGEYEGARILGRKTIELMSTNHLNDELLKDFRSTPYQAGYGYGLGVRVMIDRADGGCNGSIGEFGWCGMAGTWMMVDPKEKLSAVYMHQLFPNMEWYCHPRVRAAIYGALK